MARDFGVTPFHWAGRPPIEWDFDAAVHDELVWYESEMAKVDGKDSGEIERNRDRRHRELLGMGEGGERVFPSASNVVEYVDVMDVLAGMGEPS
jgi:hypothetical protein